MTVISPDFISRYMACLPATVDYFDCILASNGRYIADCAGDDFWIDPLKLEKEVTIFEQHPQVSMVITNWNFYNDRTHQVEPGNMARAVT